MPSSHRGEQFQPHPVNSPRGRRSFLQAKSVQAGGYTFAMVIALRTLTEILTVNGASIAIGFGLSVVALVITITISRWLLTNAWAATEGAQDPRNWLKRPHPIQFANEAVLSIVVVVASATTLAATSVSPNSVVVVTGLATYFVLAQLFLRGPLRMMIGLTGPIAILLAVLVIVLLPHSDANVYSMAIGAVIAAPFGLLAGVARVSGRGETTD